MNEDKRSLVILAGGKGSRMGEGKPKPLREVNSKPLIDYAIEIGLSNSIKDIRVVVHKDDAQISGYVSDAYPDITICRQEHQDGTATAALAGIKDARDTVAILYVDDAVLVTKNNSMKLLLETHTKSNNPVTLLTAPKDSAQDVGGLAVNEKGQITRVAPKSDVDAGADHIIFCGAMVFKKDIIQDYIQSAPMNLRTNEYDLPRIFQSLYEDGHIVGYAMINDTSQWISLNTPEQLKEVERLT